ncbi:MAG: RHS repeat-associated core domain-containing protein, partial [Anaerolineae bacterium]
AIDNVDNASAWVEAGPVTVSAVTKYYYHGGQRVAMRQGDVVYFIHADHLGSTSLTTDITGTVVAETRYLPYGEERWITGTLVTDFTFTGQRAERGFGLMDYNARYYDPGLGRFVSPDTVVPEYTNPQSLNRYTYAFDNPVRYYDSDGHCVPFCIMAAAWLAFDYLPRETLAAGSREVAGWGVPGVSDMAAMDVYAADQLWLAVNGDELGLTTKQRIDAAGEGYIALANEAAAIYSAVTLAYAAKDTLQAVTQTPQRTATASTGVANNPRRNNANQIGAWGERYAEENMGITTEQWSTVPGRRWDGYIQQQVTRRPVEVKTTTTNKVFSLNPHIRGQIAADQGQNTRWTFVGGSGISTGYQAELGGANLEWVAQPYLPGVNWQPYFNFPQ